MSKTFLKDLKAELAGGISWALLSYSLIKLSNLYPAFQVWMPALFYQLFFICSILVFFSFYSDTYNISKHIRLTLAYNVGMLFLEIFYREIVLLDKPQFDIPLLGMILITNIPFCGLLYFVMINFKKGKAS